MRVTAEVENVGKRAGDEVVQLYVRDVVASIARPVKELKGFQRVTLQPGEKRRVEFVLGPEQLGFYNREMRFVVEPGEFRVMVGSNSQDVIEQKFEVNDRKPDCFDFVLLSCFVLFSTSTARRAPALSAADEAFLEDLGTRCFNTSGNKQIRKPELSLIVHALMLAARRGPSQRRQHRRDRFRSDRALHRIGATVDRSTARRRACADNIAVLRGSRVSTTRLVLSLDRHENRRAPLEQRGLLNRYRIAAGRRAHRAPVFRKRSRNPSDSQRRIYRRVDFRWMLNGDPLLLSHGWKPESGFLRPRWDTYSEDAILYLLAIGSPTSFDPAAFVVRTVERSLSLRRSHRISRRWACRCSCTSTHTPGLIFAAGVRRKETGSIISKTPSMQRSPIASSASTWRTLFPAMVQTSGASPRLTAPRATSRGVVHRAIPTSTARSCLQLPGGSLMFTPELAVKALRTMREKYGDEDLRSLRFRRCFQSKYPLDQSRRDRHQPGHHPPQRRKRAHRSRLALVYEKSRDPARDAPRWAGEIRIA